MLQAVRHGIEVGHGANERIAAPRGGLTAASDRFLPGLPRLTEVYVKVGKGGEFHHVANLNYKKKTTRQGCLSIKNTDLIGPTDAECLGYDGLTQHSGLQIYCFPRQICKYFLKKL